MTELPDAVRQGRFRDVPAVVRGLSPADRAAALRGLKALRAEVRDWGWDRWDEGCAAQRALLVAGAACHDDAAAAAGWIAARDLRRWVPVPYEQVVEAVADRDRAWLGDVAHRLARRSATARDDYPLIHELVRRAGCAVPRTDGYLHGWVDSLSRHGARPDLASDPQAPDLVPRLFETVGAAQALVWRKEWTDALAALPATGTVARTVLVDGCVARLLLGGRQADLRFFLGLLTALEPTADEEAAHTADWAALAAQAPSPVAGHALEVLSRLAEAGRLPVRQAAEASASVLFRPEKKLVRAQLSLLARILRDDAGAAGELLPVVAELFGHEDTGMQEQALGLVGRHLGAVDADVRRALAGTAADLLSPVHRAAAVDVFGDLPEPAGADGPYEELLPPAPERGRVAPAPRALPELVGDLAEALRPGDPDPIGVERVLAGLVRHAHTDPAALREALTALLPGLWWQRETRLGPDRLEGLHLVLAALLGRVDPGDLRRALRRQAGPEVCAGERLALVWLARTQEAALRVLTEPLPFLLATPTWHTGSVDAGELVARLAEYRRLDARPAECDLAQALLRVERTGPGAAAAAEAAGALGTRAGDRLAAWLAGPAPYGPGTRVPTEAARPGRAREAGRPPVVPVAVATPGRPALCAGLPPALRALAEPFAGTDDRCSCRGPVTGLQLTVLPEDRETLAAWLLPRVARATETEEPDGARWLPVLAEAGGEAGPSLHLAVAYGLGARHSEDRLAAVDALLVLATRGELDAARLGRDLAELVRLGTVKVNRLADAVRTAAATGAYATVWTVLGAALPTLLTGGEPPRGLGELLAVGGDCAERCGDARHLPGGPPEGLAEVAARRGSTRLAVQARRLAQALRAGEQRPAGRPAKRSA
ncbi:DUF6493 family protein [Streptomyces sp. DH12]|uniref:DUF6493 family protein n=1 Tax=Streptomyces sp. DH12 TaxID=2857010 RepID=UPI001E2AF5BE|nr:DUF6493 family protein [Streptomyces sp. DH12]